jgi:hypothetical protein
MVSFHGSWSVIIVPIIFAQTTQDIHIIDHSLPLLGEYKSTTSLKHTEPLHILMGKSITTKPRVCSPWNHFFTGVLENVLLKI